MTKRVYLDNNSTMAMPEEVRNFIIELMSLPLNASSLHEAGRFAKGIIEEARRQVASLVGVGGTSRGAYQLIFTSSGTESNNLLMHNFKDADIFVSAIEHHSILKLKDYIPSVKVIRVTDRGIADLEHLEELLSASKTEKKLVSVMLANNETGILQPLKEVVEIARKAGGYVHTDAMQAAGKIEVNLPELDVDFLSLSAHKFGGPVGAGAMLHRSSHHLLPLLVGGGQERGARSGTENVVAIAGFGKAAELAKRQLEEGRKHMLALQTFLEERVLAKKPKSRIVGYGMDRLPNTTLIVTPADSAERQLIALDLQGICVSAGSACSSGKIGRSHVLEAMGMGEDEVKSAIRVSTSPAGTLQEIELFIDKFSRI